MARRVAHERRDHPYPVHRRGRPDGQDRLAGQLSRAFVKEADGPELAERPEPELPPGAPNHVTPSGHAAFLARQAALAAERPRLRGSDDGLSATRLREVEAELRYVERRLATFVVTAPPAAPLRAGFGCRITLDGPRRRVVRIVGVDEVDPAAGEISWLSPLARALTGQQVGDVVTVRTPSGEEEWELVGLIAAP